MLLSVPVFALIYAIVKASTEARLRARNLPTESSAYEKAPENLPLPQPQETTEDLEHKDETDETPDI
jgi:hypothetical protein